MEKGRKVVRDRGLNNNIDTVDNRSINFIQHYNDDNPIIQLKKSGALKMHNNGVNFKLHHII